MFVTEVDIVLKGFNSPTNISNLDFLEELDGWDIDAGVSASVVEHDEDVGPDAAGGGRRLQLNKDLQIDTGGVEGESSASYTFTSSEGACAFRVRYRFVTSEVSSVGDTQGYAMILWRALTAK